MQRLSKKSYSSQSQLEQQIQLQKLQNVNESENISKMSTSEMRRGMGGRLEEAFATAKENGKAAFVSFITAGYPNAEGKFIVMLIVFY